jgi:membrane-associated phospholipid phosphatase
VGSTDGSTETSTPRERGRVLATRREDRLLLLGIACVVAVALLYVLAVRTGWGQTIDNAALSGRTTRATVLRATDRLLNTISIASIVVVGGTIVVTAIARRRPHLALTAAVIVAGANVTAQLLKHSTLTRPVLTEPNPLGPSFPSGHTTVAFSLVVGLVLVVPARARATVAVVAFGYAALVGIGVVTAGWHRPSDVIGAELVVIGWSAFAVAGLLAWRGAARAGPGRVEIPVVPPLFAGVGLALVAVGFVGFAGAIVAIRQEQLDAVRLDATYAASMAAIVGAGLLQFAALLGALRGVRLDPTDREAEEEEERGEEPAAAPA